MTNGYQYPYTPPAPAPASSDKKGNRQQGKKPGKKGKNQPKEKTGTPNTTFLVPPSPALLNNTSIVTFMAG